MRTTLGLENSLHMLSVTATDPALLRTLRAACLRVVADRDIGNDESPLSGMCVEVSLVVLGVYGGSLVCGFVGSDRHYWNRLPSGEEVDLTSDQFGGDGYTPLALGRDVSTPSPMPIEGLIFAQCVLRTLTEVA
jgi:hypothetical protein